MVGALLAYFAIAIPSSLYGTSLHSSNASSGEEVALTLLVSLKSYGPLLLFSIFAYLIRRLPARPCTEAPLPAGYEPEEISL